MKNTILSILVAVSLVSCSDFIDDDYSSITPEVKPYVDDFFLIAKSKGLKIEMGPLKVEYIKYNDFTAGDANLSTSTLRFDTTTTVWKINKESVIFHELGHLYLGRGHDDSMILDESYQKSIMNSYCVIYWDKVRPYYIDELFNPSEKERPDLFN